MDHDPGLLVYRAEDMGQSCLVVRLFTLKHFAMEKSSKFPHHWSEHEVIYDLKFINESIF